MRELQRLRRRDARRIFAPLTVVVPHLGMARWLEHRIAEHFGICANIRFIFPGEWVQELSRRFDPQNPDAEKNRDRYQLGAMTWVLYQALEQLLAPNPPAARERYTLAYRYARLFSDYQIYRGDWLLEFARRRVGVTFSEADERQRQALLWQALQAKLGSHDRSVRFAELKRAIEMTSSDRYELISQLAPQTALFFGVAQLPPDVLALLRSLAQVESVQLYFPNPCLEYWADVVRERFLEQRALSDDLIEPERAAMAFDHFEIGHPLLASLGAQGQGFFAELVNASDQFVEVLPAAEPSQTMSLLRALQVGIERLQPAFAPNELQIDASLQVLRCACRLDELQLVKAKIIAALNADKRLRLDQIAVLAPNLDDYASLLPSVFAGESANERATAVKYCLLDTGNTGAVPGAEVLAVLELILQLDQLRFTRSDIMQLFRLEAVTQHFELDVNALEQIDWLLEQARLAFALDAEHRAQLTTASTTAQALDGEHLSLHTWVSAIDRLVLGFLHGNDQSELISCAQAAPIWPVPNVGAGQSKLLALMTLVLRQLRLAVRDIRRKRTVLDWCTWFDRQVLALAGRACTEVENYAPFKALLSQLELDATAGGLDVRVEFAAIREAALIRLRQNARLITPSLGAVCVASLIPMRALPYRWVFILGLNEGEFPAPSPPDNLNLMLVPGARRVGDRNRNHEDRYLFLEAIMASREALVLSYLAQTQEGAERAPAGVLGELLRQMHRQFGARFPGQPWLQDYCRLTLVSDRWATVAADTFRVQNRTQAKSLWEITPSELLKFWKNPLRQTLSTRFGLTPVAPAEQRDFLEPLALESDRIERIEWRLLRQAQQTGVFPDVPPRWLARSGISPSGALGAQAWEDVWARTQAIWQQFAAESPALCGQPSAPIWIDVRLSPSRVIRGWVPNCLGGSRHVLHLAAGFGSGAALLELMLKAALLQAQESEESAASASPWKLRLHTEVQSVELALFDRESARAYLNELVDIQQQALTAIDESERSRVSLPWFWPRLSWLSARGKNWPKGFFGEAFELKDSGFHRFYPSEAEFRADTAVYQRHLELATRVYAPIARPSASSASFEQLGYESESDELPGEFFGDYSGS